MPCKFVFTMNKRLLYDLFKHNKMKHKIVHYLFAFIFLMLLSSCGLVFKSVFGFKKIKEIKTVEYNAFINNIDDQNTKMVFVKSDSTFVSKISDYGYSKTYKNYLKQPMQVFLFSENELKFFVANCLVRPKLPNLDWNYQSKFEAFPPKNTINIDSLGLSLDKFIKHNKTIAEFNVDNYKYAYFVNWNLISGRQSKLLIEEIKNNILAFNKEDSTLIILSNTDDFYIKSDIGF